MKIETKFNIGDRVWFMYLNKPVQVTVSAITIFTTSTGQLPIRYSSIDHFCENILEVKLFGSKAELIDSLFKD